MSTGRLRALERYIYLFRAENPAGKLLAELLPDSDFDQWYEAACASHVGSIGSAKLNWPLDRKERVSLQYKLIELMSSGEIDISNFSLTFTYSGSNNINENNLACIERVIVPFHNDVLRLLRPSIESQSSPVVDSTPVNQRVFIDSDRINELQKVESPNFDLSKLIKMCEELNVAYSNDCLLSVAALTRSLIDHVPPIFNCGKFSEVSNNYAGTMSFKQSMSHLQNSARSIGDAHLHTHVRKTETLPTVAQVNFSNDIDVLLSEIVRLLK